MLYMISGDIIKIHKQGNIIMHFTPTHEHCPHNIIRVFPKVGTAEHLCRDTFEHLLGTYTGSRTAHGLVISAFVQRASVDYVDLEALGKIVKELEERHSTIYVRQCSLYGELLKIFADSKINFVMVLS